VERKFTKVVDVVTGEQIDGQARGKPTGFDSKLKPASYRVFSAEQ
jgi:hypothetical protein